MLPLYDKMRRAGGLNMTPKPKSCRRMRPTALIDADAGLGHPVAIEAMNLAVKKCKEIGFGAVSVVNSHHFGATGLYAEMAARQGAVALVTSSARTVAVIPTGGTTPVLGTNPIAFAAPSSQGDPFLLDMSTSRRRRQQGEGLCLSSNAASGRLGRRRSAVKPVSDPKEGFRMCMESDVGRLDADGRDARNRHT